MAGSFVFGAAAGSAPTAVAIVNFPLHSELGPPSDPFYVDQWGLQSIGAPNAWSVTLGSRSVLVAVVDTGVWWTQPDIQANMWTNPIDGTHGRAHRRGRRELRGRDARLPGTPPERRVGRGDR